MPLNRKCSKRWYRAAVGVAAVIFFLGNYAPVRAQQVVNEVVASVDGDPITERDVEEFLSQHGESVGTDDFLDSPIARKALKALIDEKLLEEEQKKYEDKVDEAQVDRYIDQLRQGQHMTEQQMRDSLQQQGISYEDFRKRARDNLVKQEMIEGEVREKIKVSDADIVAFYNEHKEDVTVKTERLRIAQILVSVPANATAQQDAAAKRKADAIRAQIMKGMDFNDLALKYSDDDSKTKGGELGWFEPGDINDAIFAAIKNLKPGDVSPVVRTKFGYHIMKLEAHEIPGPRPLSEVKDSIREELQNERMQAQLQNWTETELIKKHYVETVDPKLFATTK
ncbi:MAG TPA: peptidylprolyl isomerase [Candidatus Binataceae bacterium]|nr:peptidylprolyl isomerase [Candidatus Binataceae bacterium]